ncbi:MAG: DUF1328 domain-containing protein [Luteolibacter sp.]
MFQWTVIFSIITLIAGFLGFSRWAGSTAGVAQVLFYIFLGLTLSSTLTLAFNRKLY